MFYWLLRHWVVGPYMTRVFRPWVAGIEHIPEHGGAKSSQSLDAALQKLQEGQLIGIYPEGTRSPDGKLYRGRTGVARMVLDARVPVIPCVMVDTEKVMPIGRRLPRVGRIGMIFGEPLDFSRYYNLEGDRFVLRSITDEIMVTLNRISDQEYVDVYASSVKAKVEAERKALAAGR